MFLHALVQNYAAQVFLKSYIYQIVDGSVKNHKLHDFQFRLTETIFY